VKITSPLLCAAIAVTTAIPTFAQNPIEPPPETKIQTLLRSGDPQQIAWGAHYVLTTKDRALLPELLNLADTWQPLPSFDKSDLEHSALTSIQVDRRDAMGAVLDTLIQMQASVSVQTLRNLAFDFPNYAAILLARLPLSESEPLTFDLFRVDPVQTRSWLHIYGLQYVSAVLLAQSPPPGFAAGLLSQVHANATIFVTSPGADRFGSGHGDHDCFMPPPAEPRKQWPSFGVYELHRTKSDGSLQIISGANPVYAKRSQTTRYRDEQCVENVVLGAEESQDLLVQMLNILPGSIVWQTATVENIEFKSEQQFASDLQAFISGEQEKYRATANALIAKGLMSPSEAEDALPQLNLRINDMRGANYSELRLPSLPARVAWVDGPWK
jgi:hypothetical protein